MGMSEENEPKEIEPKSSRILFCYFVVVLLLGLVAVGILFRAFDTAFVERDKWMKVAESQKRPNRLVLPGRGNIYSSDGKLMATSVPRYYMYIDFKADAYTPAKDAKYNWLDTFKTSKKDGVDSLAFYLSRKLKDRTPAGYKAYLLKGLSGKSRQFPIYAGKVSYSDLKEIRKFPFLRLGRYKSGFYTKEMVQRQKPFGTLASRTIGDIYGEIEEGGTTKGKNGLELQYDSLLRGQAGLSSVRRVGGGWTNVIEVDPVDGMDIRTTIDINIQDITEKSLVDKLKAIDAESGTAVVMEVETGEIKAITNMGRIREGVYGETKNHAVADEIEPGSTFKVASIMVALEDGLCNPGDTVDVGNGIYMYKGARMTDHNMNKGGYGRISVEQAIWYSSNIGVAKTILKGYSDNPTKFVEGLYRIGMNADLRLEIPGAGRAKIRRPDDTTRYWSKTTLPWMSFGYETQVPPINTLAFFNAIANDGKMVRPMFTKEILHNGKTVQSFSTEVINSSICSDHTLALIKDMLLGVVEKGTGKAVHSDIVRIAGKTGTAYNILSGRKQEMEMRDISRYTKADITEIPVPTSKELRASATEETRTQLLELAAQPSSEEALALAQELLAQASSPEQLLAALVQKQLDAATKNLPTFDVPKPIRKGKRAGAKTVRVHINAGRKDRMAPNFILGALVEATGMAGNEFGKIDIHDQYTTVEVPETETDFVIDAMQDEKINGKAVSVRRYEERDNDHRGGSHSGRGGRNGGQHRQSRHGYNQHARSGGYNRKRRKG